MENSQVIMDGFHCGRSRANVINVYNGNSYVMAEYNEISGALVWHRVVLSSQKAIIESWLYSHFQGGKDQDQTKKQRVAQVGRAGSGRMASASAR